MSVEIHQPEIEALIQQRMDTGVFHDVEEMLIHALKSAPEASLSPAVPLGTTLLEAFAELREILDGEELEFARNPSMMRKVDLS